MLKITWPDSKKKSNGK